MDLGWQELVIILVVVMIVFGAGKLPDVAKSLGQGVKEFKSAAGEADGIAGAAGLGQVAAANGAPAPAATTARVAVERPDEI